MYRCTERDRNSDKKIIKSWLRDLNLSVLYSAPEKRQRVPSAYNRFIKWVMMSSSLWLSLSLSTFFLHTYFIYKKIAKFEAKMWMVRQWICRDEIQRIKSVNPDISHREAFSAAAKNVMLFLQGFFFTKLARVVSSILSTVWGPLTNPFCFLCVSGPTSHTFTLVSCLTRLWRRQTSASRYLEPSTPFIRSIPLHVKHCLTFLFSFFFLIEL